MTALNPSLRLVKSGTLPIPNKYVLAMGNEFAQWVFNEERAVEPKGKWRQTLGLKEGAPLDLEIGTGNGYFFANYCQANPERTLLGMELKFKPLIQTIKRTVNQGSTNGRVIRYHAALVSEMFAPEEIDNAFIYFPDPWPKKRHFKNRLITAEFLNILFALQKPGSFLEIKTDHPGYFEWIMERAPQSRYQIVRQTEDLHKSEWSAENFQTHFEKLWTSKGLPTHMVRLLKPSTII